MNQIVMLDTQHIVRDLYSNLKQLTTNTNVLSLSYQTALDLVILAITNDIESRSMYPVEINNSTNVSTLEERIIELARFTTINTKKIKATINNISELLSNVSIELAPQIKLYVPYKNYYDWTILSFGGSLGLIRGMDYRVKEYYRLTKTDVNTSVELKVSIEPIINFIAKKFFGRNININTQLIIQKTIIDSLLRKYPNVKQVTTELDSRVNNYYQTVVVNWNDVDQLFSFTDKIIDTYGKHMFKDFLGAHVSKDFLDSEKFYELESTLGTLVFTEVESIDTIADVDGYSLALSLINGDYLPMEEREIAEKYLNENFSQFDI